MTRSRATSDSECDLEWGRDRIAKPDTVDRATPPTRRERQKPDSPTARWSATITVRRGAVLANREARTLTRFRLVPGLQSWYASQPDPRARARVCPAQLPRT